MGNQSDEIGAIRHGTGAATQSGISFAGAELTQEQYWSFAALCDDGLLQGFNRREASGQGTRQQCRRPVAKEQTSENSADQKTIVDELANFIERFVFLPDSTLYLLVAAWVTATYLHRRFQYTGYLFAHSPEPQSGKTTLLEILDLLVYNSTGVQVSPTEAVLFRTAEGHTQLLDEVDSWTNNEDLKQVLNAGYKKGAKVTRMDKSPKAGLEPKSFSVYAPRALAGIGVSILHRATLDRTFDIAMVRQKQSEKRERYRDNKMGSEVELLKKRIESWVKSNEDEVLRAYDDGNFPYLNSFSDRTMDIAEPLAAIVTVVYRGHPNVKARIRSLTEAIALTRKEQKSLTSEHRLLRHLLALSEVEDKGELVGNASELAAMCGNLELGVEVNQYFVSRVLHQYGFKTKSARNEGNGGPRYRYTLMCSELREIVNRWAPDAETTSASAARQQL